MRKPNNGIYFANGWKHRINMSVSHIDNATTNAKRDCPQSKWHFFFITIFVVWIVMKCSVIKLNGYGSCIWVTFKMFIDWRKSKRNSREFSLKYKVVKKVFLKLTFARRFRVGIQQKIARFNNFLKMSTHLIALMRLYTNSFQRTNNALATITCAMCMNRYEQTIY